MDVASPTQVAASVASPARRGFVLQPRCRTLGGRTEIQLFGVFEEGGSFVVEDDRFRPYCFVREADVSRLAPGLALRTGADDARSLAGEPLRRIEAATPGDLSELRQTLARAGVATLESDLRPAYRFLIDRGLRSGIEIRGRGRPDRRGLWHFHNPVLAGAEVTPRLRVLSLDIETAPDASRVYSVALVGSGADEVHVVREAPVEGARAHPDEAALLRGVLERLRALDPDVVLGWNIVDFDLRVLARRCAAHGIRFAPGRTGESVRFRRDESFTRQSRAEVAGIQVLDGQGLLRDAGIVLEDYRLETAARRLLGRGKRIEGDGRERGAEIARLFRDDPAGLAAYNREDARLVLDLVEREGLLALALERSRLTGMQLDRVGASIASFDLLVLPELRRRGYVAPDVQSERANAAVLGGAVLESSPGLFRNVAVFDFKSLYPSLIRTFNLDPLAFARAGDDGDPLVAPNGARLARAPGILPGVLRELGRRRDAARARGDRHADFAIKILMNACFGVLAARTCRFFAPELANAITTFGQQLLHWTRAELEAEGARVLYGDTDSVFVALDADADERSALASAVALRARIEARIRDRVRERYRVEPELELALARLYRRFFQPRLRGARQGSKKRYAGLRDGAVEVVGLEAVRRDWPPVVRRLQVGMLERLFADQPVLPFVRELALGVRDGRFDRELVIRKGLRKGSVERYEGRMPPHVEAARRAGQLEGREVRYVWTRRGPEPVAAAGPWPADVDRERYVDKQLRPVADAILECVGQSFDEALGRPRQLSLL
jgi:DNA polymerase II